MDIRPGIAIIVLISLLAQSPLEAHQAAVQAPKLNIEIVEGEGAVNNIRQRMARAPMVQVTDENRKPVGGAVVVFLLPNQGAGGTFINGARSLTVLTDANGNAVAQGIQANQVSGEFQLQVTASKDGQTVTRSINMRNAALTAAGGAGAAGALKWLLILGAAGGVAAGVAVATTGNGGPSGPVRTPTAVTPGAPNAGAPQ